MFHFKLVALLITFSAFSTFVVAKTVQNVAVLLSKNHSSALKRLEVKILENFGRKFNLSVDYVTSNDSLNCVFDSKTRFERFLNSTEFL